MTRNDKTTIEIVEWLKAEQRLLTTTHAVGSRGWLKLTLDVLDAQEAVLDALRESLA